MKIHLYNNGRTVAAVNKSTKEILLSMTQGEIASSNVKLLSF